MYENDSTNFKILHRKRGGGVGLESGETANLELEASGFAYSIPLQMTISIDKKIIVSLLM